MCVLHSVSRCVHQTNSVVPTGFAGTVSGMSRVRQMFAEKLF